MSQSLQLFKERLYPQVSRGMIEFAQEEVRLPKGPRKGLHFDWDYAPFNKFIAEAIMSDYWRKVAIVGPTQNGKTLVATNIPLLYYLFEVEEDVIFGLPSMDLASGMWIEKIRPIIEDSKYRDLLPTSGAGSRGGSFSAVQFKNGVNLRFMGAGGSAEQMSSHTSSVVILTEIDKMDKSSGDGAEADPVTLIQNRADSFENSKIIMECTVTTFEGRIWQEAIVQGSGGQIYVACPTCNHWQTLVRENLSFDPTSQVSAEASAKYECSGCQCLWDNNDRLEALDNPLLVHRGQSVEAGVVVGELPPTKNFGMRYNVLHSPMQSLAKTCGQQYEADASDLKEKKKGMIQSKWAEPYIDKDVNRTNLTKGNLRALANDGLYDLMDVPEWVDKLTLSVDVQQGYCYWQCEGYNMTTMRSLVIEYGTVDQREDNDAAIMNMLSEVDLICKEGWMRAHDAKLLFPDVKLVDCGFQYHVIQLWLAANRSWIGIKGIGKNEKNKLSGAKEIFKIDGILTVRQQKNGQNLWFIEVDQTKALVHDRYLLPSRDLDYYRHVPRNVDITWINSITAEERVYDPLGESFTWERKRRRNDYLDTASYNVAGSYILKQKTNRSDTREQNKVNEREKQVKSPNPPRRQQRNRGGLFTGDRRTVW